MERALTRMAGELEWSYRYCSRGRKRCTENSLLQVSIQPSGIFVNLDYRREKIADLVPVDIPINLAIAAAWKIASQPYNSIPVYNCTSGSINPIRWGQLETMGMAAIRKFPMENVLWYPGGSYKESALHNTICQVNIRSSQMLPTHII